MKNTLIRKKVGPYALAIFMLACVTDARAEVSQNCLHQFEAAQAKCNAELKDIAASRYPNVKAYLPALGRCMSAYVNMAYKACEATEGGPQAAAEILKACQASLDDLGYKVRGKPVACADYVPGARKAPPECGMEPDATVEDRLASCSKLPGSSKKTSTGAWSLVERVNYRDGDGQAEIWRDEATGLLWTKPSRGTGSLESLVDIHEKKSWNPFHHENEVGQDKFCSSEEAATMTGGIRDRKFGIPSLKEFEKAVADGLNELHAPDFAFGTYWTRDLVPQDHYMHGNAIAFEPSSGGVVYLGPFSPLGFRCVGRQ